MLCTALAGSALGGHPLPGMPVVAWPRRLRPEGPQAPRPRRIHMTSLSAQITEHPELLEEISGEALGDKPAREERTAEPAAPEVLESSVPAEKRPKQTFQMTSLSAQLKDLNQVAWEVLEDAAAVVDAATEEPASEERSKSTFRMTSLSAQIEDRSQVAWEELGKASAGELVSVGAPGAGSAGEAVNTANSDEQNRIA